MIIDDDIPMLKYLRRIIDWESLNIEIVFESASSLKALENFDQVKPDIVLTDIGLPQMDGIELATKIREKSEDTRVLFLTCHEDFSYAKKAVKLKADDYLIKDELTPEQLKESMEKVTAQLAQLPKEKFFKETEKHNVQYLKRSIISELATDTNMNILEESIARLNPFWKLPYFKIAIGYMPQIQGEVYEQYKEKTALFYQRLEVLFQDDQRIEVFLNEDHILFLMNFKPNIKFDIHAFLDSRLKEISLELEPELDSDICFLIVRQQYQLEQLDKTYKQVLKDKYSYFYEENESVFMFNLEETYKSIPLGNLLEFQKLDLLEAVKTGNADTIHQLVEQIEYSVRQNNIEPRDVLKGFTQFILYFKVELNYFEEDEFFSKKMRRCRSLTEAVSLFRETLIELTGEQQPLQPSSSDAKKLYEIDDYIANNLSENIRAVDMAKHLYFNPSYFSRYFKRLTGDTFTDHVHRYKMKAACRYLVNTSEPIENIGLKVGFRERTYFSKVFKKYIGETPSQYRNNHRNKIV